MSRWARPLALLFALLAGSSLAEEVDQVEFVAFSPDSTRLATFSTQRTRIWSASDGHLLLEVPAMGRHLGRGSWRPDGKQLVGPASDGRGAVLVDAATGALERRFGNGEVRVAAFSPDGSRIALAYAASYQIELIEPATGAVSLAFRVAPPDSNEKFGVDDLHWIPGFEALHALANGAVGTFLAKDGAPEGRCKAEPYTASMAVSPDGSMFALGAKGTLTLDPFSASRKKILDVEGTVTTGISFAPGGERIAIAGWQKTGFVIDPRTGETIAKVGQHQALLSSIAFSPDGKLLATGSRDGTATLARADGATIAVLGGAAGATVAAPPSAAPPMREEAGPPAQAVQVVAQTGHRLWASALAFSPDGRLVVSGGRDSRLIVWAIDTGLQLAELRGHEKEINAVAFSADGRLIASASEDGTARVWEVSSGKQVRKLPRHGLAVTGVAFSRDGRLATAGDKLVYVWDLGGGEPAQITLQSFANGVAFSGDGTRLGVCTAKGEIFVVDTARLRAGEELPAKGVLWATDATDRADLRRLAFDPSGKRLSAMSPGAIYTFDEQASTGWRLPDAGLGRLHGISYGPGGALAIAGAQGVLIRASDRRDEPRAPLRLLAEPLGYAVAFNPSGSLLAAPVSGGIRVWDVRSGSVARELRPRAGVVSRVQIFAKGPVLAAAGSELHLTDLSTGKDVPLGAAMNAARELSPDRSRALVVNEDQELELREVRTGRPIRRLVPTLGLGSHAFSPDGRTVWLVHESKVAVFDANDGALLRTLQLGGSWLLSSLAFSPDGAWVAAASEAGGVVWDARTFAERRRLSAGNDRIASLAAGPGGRWVVAGTREGSLALWEVASTAPPRIVNATAPGDSIGAVAFSPTGAQIASGSAAGAIQLWSAETLALQRQRRAHAAEIRSLAYFPDGRLLASGGDDAAVVLTETATGAEVARVINALGGESVIVLPDSRYLAARSALSAVGFRAGERSYPFEQFDLKLNRPDEVLARLGFARPELLELMKRARQRRLSRMGFTEDQLAAQTELPTVDLAPLPASTPGKSVSLGLQLRAPGSRLDRLLVHVNDVPIHGSRGLDLRARAAGEARLDVPVSLVAGRNKLQVSVLDQRGVESLKATAEVVSTAAARRELYLIAIGVSRYRDAANNLTYAAKDAADVVAVLEAGRQRFAAVHAVPLLDEKATREGILAVRTLLEGSKPDDQVVLFAAGHGLLDESRDYWFATHDVDFERPSARGLSYEALEGLLDGIPAREKLLLIDTCHSGEVDKDDVAVAAPQAGGPLVARRVGARGIKRVTTVGLATSLRYVDELFADLRRGSGAAVISSAGGAEYAIEDGALKNGVFTFAVVDGLRGRKADRNGDGVVTVSELRDYVGAQVEKLTAGQQRPTSRRENLALDFVVHQPPAEIARPRPIEAAPAGDVQVEPKSGVEWVVLPGGRLVGGNFPGQTVQPFSLARTATTVAAYGKCVAAGACTEPKTGGECNWRAGRDNHPVNCVDWNQAGAFCRWIGGRLPSSPEREWAASGGEAREYPWGAQPPARQLCWNGEGSDLGKGNRKTTCPVGSYPAGDSKHGLKDLTGNVWELLDTNYEGGKEVRGGSWFNVVPDFYRAVFRVSYDPSKWNVSLLGFRCARQVE